VFGINLASALSSLGYLAVALFVGIESIGVPLPGETMLITAAAYAGATHALNIVAVIAVAAAAAIVGDNIGFGIGWFGGYPLLRRFGRYVRLDEAKLKVLPPGSFYTEPPSRNHFAETGSEAVVVQITGFGPSSTVYVDATQDPRKSVSSN